MLNIKCEIPGTELRLGSEKGRMQLRQSKCQQSEHVHGLAAMDIVLVTNFQLESSSRMDILCFHITILCKWGLTRRAREL
jgi:hypothetical protein